MYDYHPDLVCILFVRSHPYILLHLRNVFYYLFIIGLQFIAVEVIIFI